MSSTRGKNPMGRNQGGKPKFKRGLCHRCSQTTIHSLTTAPRRHTQLPGGQCHCPIPSMTSNLAYLGCGDSSLQASVPHPRDHMGKPSVCHSAHAGNVAQTPHPRSYRSIGLIFLTALVITCEIKPTFPSLGSVTRRDPGHHHGVTDTSLGFQVSNSGSAIT